MKPTNKFEKEACVVNDKLHETISVFDTKLAIKSIDENEACLESGSFVYFTIKEQHGGFDIDRLYRCYLFRNKKSVIHLFAEVVRKFTRDGVSRYFSKIRTAMNSYCAFDCFGLGTSIELRSAEMNTNGYTIADLFRLSDCVIDRHSGKRIRCVHVNPSKLNQIIRVPYGETLYNAEENMLINYLVAFPYVNKMLPSIRIAKKHGFVFTKDNVVKWFDMVYDIIYTKNDNHNPKFVAPDNLDEMHNYFVEKAGKKRIADDRRRMELALIREEKKALEEIERKKHENEEYIARRRRFFDLDIHNSKFSAYVLRDVRDFFDEGSYMQHCVFANKYYLKKSSLILSVRDINGKRVETVEVDLDSCKILQSYGKHDHFTKHHDEILKLIRSNMNKIKMCYHSKYKPSKKLLKAV